MNKLTMSMKDFYTAQTKNKQRRVIVFAASIGEAHKAAQEYFGKGTSFTTRISTHDETLHADPSEVLRA